MDYIHPNISEWSTRDFGSQPRANTIREYNGMMPKLAYAVKRNSRPAYRKTGVISSRLGTTFNVLFSLWFRVIPSRPARGGINGVRHNATMRRGVEAG